MKATKEQAAEWFEKMHPPGPAAREMYRMAAEALRDVGGRIPGRCENCDLWNRWDEIGRKSQEIYICSCAYWSEEGVIRYTSPDDFCSGFVPREEGSAMSITREEANKCLKSLMRVLIIKEGDKYRPAKDTSRQDAYRALYEIQQWGGICDG